jgi:hypothetical protein
LRINSLWRTALLQALLVPAFAGSGANLPVAVAANWLLGPLIGQYFLLICGAVLIVPQLSALADLLWSALVWVLTQLTLLAGGAPGGVTGVFFLAAYTCGLHLLWLGYERWRRR